MQKTTSPENSTLDKKNYINISSNRYFKVKSIIQFQSQYGAKGLVRCSNMLTIMTR